MSRKEAPQPFLIACDNAQYKSFLSGETNSQRLAEMKRTVLRIIEEELTESQREMTVMYYFREMTVTEIAESRGVNKSTVSRTLSRARSRIERVLRYWYKGE